MSAAGRVGVTGSSVLVISPLWLSEVYFMVDYDRGVVELAKAGNDDKVSNPNASNPTTPVSHGVKINVEWWAVALGLAGALWI